MKLPNFIQGAIYRAKSGLAHSFASEAKFNCYMPAETNIPPNAYVADCWVCDQFGRIDPNLNVSPVPVRKKDLGRIINTQSQAQKL